MIYIVTPENEHHYRDEMEQAFRLRHRVFVEQMGWRALANRRDQSDLAAPNDSASFSSDTIGPATNDGGTGDYRGHNLIRLADIRAVAGNAR